MADPPLDMPEVMPDNPVPREGHLALPEGSHPTNSHRGGERLLAQPTP